MNNELVTIIMPIYNEEKYLQEAIQSIVEQTYVNWELICINDASTDQSLELLNQYKSDKIKIISLQKNSGSAIARNEGIKQAKGRYIAYLDGDDYYHKNKLEKQLTFMQKNQYAITYTGYAFFNENKKIKHVKVPTKLTYKDYLKNTMITSLGIMIDTTRIPKEQLYMQDLKIAEDTKTWLNILKQGEIAYGINETLGYYRQGKNSKSNNKIKATKAVWNIYINEEIPKTKAVYYFLCYVLNAIKKRICF